MITTRMSFDSLLNGQKKADRAQHIIDGRFANMCRHLLSTRNEKKQGERLAGLEESDTHVSGIRAYHILFFLLEAKTLIA
jgi:hypothetical protein